MALIFGGGLLVATLDIALAMGFWHWRAQVPPSRILQSIAAGLLGREAYGMGTSSALLGAVLHLGIACGMAAVYWIASRRNPWLRQAWVTAGLIYGALLYIAMNFVVLPLSRATPVPFAWDWFAASIFSHLLLVGLPLAWMARVR
jgi:uncharacterized membrane protein YagU involved in acid resistance